MARKGTTALTMNTDKQTMGFDGTTGLSLVEELDIIEKALKNSLSFDSPKHAVFYEVLSHALIWTERDALAILKKSSNVEGIGQRFSEKMGLDSAVNVALRLIPINAEMHSDNWWDIHIEPSFRSPHQCYRVSIVYRNPDRSTVTDITGRIEQMLRSSVELVEGVDE